MVITYSCKFSEDIRYAYSVGRIRALEGKLLTLPKIERLIEAKTKEEMKEILQDTWYSEWIEGGYENMINKARRELYQLMEKIIVDKEVIEMLRLRYDYFNAKLLVKGKIGEKKVDHLMSEFGNISKREMGVIFSEEKYEKLKKYYLSEAISECIEQYFSKKESRWVDLILDKYYYKYLLETIRNPFFLTLVKIEITLINLKSFLRSKFTNEGRQFFEKSFIQGGYLPLFHFVPQFEEPFENIPNYFSTTPYFKIVQEGVNYFLKQKSFIVLEKECDSHLIEFLRKAKYVALGVEPILAYFYIRENEFKILRLIFVGKKSKIKEELIKKRLPIIY